MLRYLVQLIPTLFFFLPLSAQGEHPILRHYGAKEGLPSSEVYEVLQDRNGYIWVSTDNGVSRFNGYQFETFGIEDGLTDPVVFYLFEDHRGWIWMYSFKDKIFVYKDGTITEFVHTDLIHSFRANNQAKGLDWIYVDAQGVFYTSVTGNGIAKIEQNGACTDLTEGIPGGYALWTHENQRFYTHKYYEYFGASFATDPTYDGYLDNVNDNVLLTILQDDGSRLVKPYPYWVYGNTNVYNIHPNGVPQPVGSEVWIQFQDRIELINVQDGKTLQQIPYQRGTITAFLEGSKAPFLYMGHNFGERGLTIFDRADFRRDLNLLTEPALQLLPGKTITHLLEDEQGGIWIGTLDDGVYYIINPELLLGYFSNPELRKPRTIVSGNQDTIWVRVQEHEIYCISESGGMSLVPQGPAYGNNRDLSYDQSRNRLWASGLSRYWDGADWIFLTHEGQTKRRLSVEKHYRSRIIEPSHHNPDRIWCGETTSFYNIDMGGVSAWPVVSKNYFLEPQQRIFDILENPKGQVYIGGMQGLYEFQTGTGHSRKIEHHPALNNRIEDLAIAADGTLVVGTKGGGVLFWDRDTIYQITTADGLNSDYIEQLHIDSLQQIWVGTNYGINKIERVGRTTFKLNALSLADGMPSNEIADITSKGRDLWVATVDGMFHYPIDATLNNGPVVPVIEEIQVNGERQSLARLAQLKWFEDNIRITVVSLDYPQQGKVAYRYRFAKDDQWQTTQNQTIEVARLSPGSYGFEIQAQGRDRTWSSSVMVPLSLQNPFWLSLWFWLLLVAGLIISVILYYNRNLRRQAEKQRQEKQLLLLERELTELRQQAYRAQMNPHFVYNCLTAIQSFMLSNDTDQLLASDYLSKFAMLTRQALDASRNKTISLSDDIKMLENYIQLEQFRFGNRFTYEITLDSELPIHDISIPALLVQPYVENAILHGLAGLNYPGTLSIDYTQEHDFLLITIKDNGMGIHQHKARQSEGRAVKKHQSAGMDIARKRIEGTVPEEELSGSVLIEEILDGEQVQGTQITVKIPLD